MSIKDTGYGPSDAELFIKSFFPAFKQGREQTEIRKERKRAQSTLKDIFGEELPEDLQGMENLRLSDLPNIAAMRGAMATGMFKKAQVELGEQRIEQSQEELKSSERRHEETIAANMDIAEQTTDIRKKEIIRKEKADDMNYMAELKTRLIEDKTLKPEDRERIINDLNKINVKWKLASQFKDEPGMWEQILNLFPSWRGKVKEIVPSTITQPKKIGDYVPGDIVIGVGGKRGVLGVDGEVYLIK